MNSPPPRIPPRKEDSSVPPRGPHPFLEEPEEGWLERHRARVLLVCVAVLAVLASVLIAQVQARVPWLAEPHRVLKVMIGAVLALVVLSRPFLSLALMPLAFVYLLWLPKSPIPLVNGMNLLIGSLLYGWIGQAVISRREMFERSPWDLPLLLFLTWFFFAVLRSAALSEAGPAAYSSWVGLFWRSASGLILFFPIYNIVRTWKQIRLLALLFCVGSALGFFGIARMALSFGWGRGVGGGVGQVNEAAAYFATATIFCLAMLSAGYRGFWQRLTLLGSLAACAAALIIPASRGAYAGFLLGASTQLMRAGILWLLVLGLLVGAFFLWAPDYVRERVLRAEEAVTAEDGRLDAINEVGGGRIDFWKASLRITAEHPIIGVGYGQISHYIFEEIGRTKPSHNLYLETAGEMGIPGLALLLWLFLSAIFAANPLLAHRGFPRALGLGFQSAVLVLMVANIFGNRFFAFNLAGMMSYLCALVLRARRLIEQGDLAGTGGKAE